MDKVTIEHSIPKLTPVALACKQLIYGIAVRAARAEQDRMALQRQLRMNMESSDWSLNGTRTGRINSSTPHHEDIPR